MERKPWTLIDGSEDGGVYKSVDGGDNWERVHGGLPDKGLLGKVDIAISPADSSRIWVMQQTSKEETGGLYRSDDGGENWQRVNGEHKLRQRQYYYTHLHADPVDNNTVYALNTGFYKSTDAGKTFESISVPHGDVHDLWLNPENPDIMVNSNDGGANVTVDGGKTWTTQLNQPTAEFYRVEVDNQFPYRVYGAQQDNSTISVPGKSPGDVSPKQHWYSVGGGESGAVAVHPENPDLVYAGTYSGEITRFNRKTGQVLQLTPYPHYTEGTKMTELKYRFQWNYPIVISKHDPDNIYITSQYVHRSTDGGFNWEVISPDLTTNNPDYLDLIPGGPIQHEATGVEVYCSVFSFAESPHREGELWAGSDDGLLHISRDGGKTWKNITPTEMPKDGTVNSIDISSFSPGTAYVAVYRYRRADFTPYIFKTDNYGASWSLLTSGNNGIPPDHFVRVVREDPNREGLLYAGTEFGMYISFDDGLHWQPFQLNLPHTPVTDIEVHDRDLVLSTQGRSFWILDDLSPLHQLNEMVRESDFYLYKPRPAYRTQLSGNPGNPGPDPYPTGALIYFQANKPGEKQSVRLEILDSRDRVIRTWSTSPDKDKGTGKLEIRTGLNRFEWDLDYPGPFTVDDLVTMVMKNPAAGPEAVPGVYKVRLTAGELVLTESFELRADPRWEVPVSDLQGTFNLAVEIRDMITGFQKVIERIRSVRKRAMETADLAVKNGFPDDIKSSADELGRKLTELEDLLINNSIKSRQDPIG
ncbi:MAG: glycosyl hydrolase, partial [Acidobacteriota bacterium]